MRALSWIGACAVGLGAAVCRAQDPPAPPGGFSLQSLLDHPVTWSDGYLTRLDAWYPLHPVPATGWPAVLVVHAAGDSRNAPDTVAACRELARAGYVAFAFDVRSFGETRTLNPGAPLRFPRERELLDSAESHLRVGAALPGVVDAARRAVAGLGALGGGYAVDAAVWSARTLPLAGDVSAYPRLTAVAVDSAPVDRVEDLIARGVLVNDDLVRGADLSDPVVRAVANGDYFAARSMLTQRVAFDPLPNLAQSSVPVLTAFSLRDGRRLSAGDVIDPWRVLRPGVPLRVLLSTGGSDTPDNVIESALAHDLRRRWLDRWLKVIGNGVDIEPLAEVGVVPDFPAYLDPQTQWHHATSTDWPPATAAVSWFLRAGGVLATTPPAGVENGPIVQQRVAPGYGLDQYVQGGAGGAPGAVTNSIPHSAQLFAATAPVGEVQLFGRPTAQLHVLANRGTFQISVEVVHIDAGGRFQYVTGGTDAVRFAQAGLHMLRFDLDDVALDVPAGSRLGVIVQNLAIHDVPGRRSIRVVPEFSDFELRVLISPGFESRVELPQRERPVALMPRLKSVSTSTSVAETLTLDGGVQRGGMSYFVALGCSGSAPGFQAPGLPPLPLNPDVWTSVGLQLMNSVILPAWAGVLDVDGCSSPRIAVPATIGGILLGRRWTVVGYVADGTLAASSVGGPATLVFVP